MILVQHFFERLTEIAHEAAANAAGIHLGHFDAGFFQKAAVNADFAKLVFNQYQLFALISFFNQLFNERRFACTQKAGKNCNFCHNKLLLSFGKLRAHNSHTAAFPLL